MTSSRPLRGVHRGLRHARPERGEGAPRRTGFLRAKFWAFAVATTHRQTDNVFGRT